MFENVRPSPPPSSLLTPEYLRLLEALAFQTRRPYAGKERGERKSPRKGSSVEFAEHRGYVPGDDPRFLDWNLYGRLDRLCLKTFHEEEDLTIHLLLDSSASMGYGDPPKWLVARAVAGALAHLGLAGLDRVGVAAFGGDRSRILAPARGRGRLLEVLRFLDAVPAEGGTILAPALRRFAREARPGVSVVISDFLASGWEDWLRPLVHRRHTLALIQVLAPEEIAPRDEGDVALVDAETGEKLEVSLSERLVRAYREMLEALRSSLREWSFRHSADFLSLSSGESLETILTGRLPALSLLHR